MVRLLYARNKLVLRVALYSCLFLIGGQHPLLTFKSSNNHRTTSWIASKLVVA